MLRGAWARLESQPGPHVFTVFRGPQVPWPALVGTHGFRRRVRLPVEALSGRGPATHPAAASWGAQRRSGLTPGPPRLHGRCCWPLGDVALAPPSPRCPARAAEDSSRSQARVPVLGRAAESWPLGSEDGARVRWAQQPWRLPPAPPCARRRAVQFAGAQGCSPLPPDMLPSSPLPTPETGGLGSLRCSLIPADGDQPRSPRPALCHLPGQSLVGCRLVRCPARPFSGQETRMEAETGRPRAGSGAAGPSPLPLAPCDLGQLPELWARFPRLHGGGSGLLCSSGSPRPPSGPAACEKDSWNVTLP